MTAAKSINGIKNNITQQSLIFETHPILITCYISSYHIRADCEGIGKLLTSTFMTLSFFSGVTYTEISKPMFMRFDFYDLVQTFLLFSNAFLEFVQNIGIKTLKSYKNRTLITQLGIP